MFTHCVFFWLKPGMTADEKTVFESKVRALTTIPGVIYATVGTPAPTDRPVVERSYTLGLLTVFRDKAGHDAYQVDPIHDEFRNSSAAHLEKVVVYDFEG